MAEMIFSKVDCAIKFALLGTAVLALGTEQRRGRRDGRGAAPDSVSISPVGDQTVSAADQPPRMLRRTV